MAKENSELREEFDRMDKHGTGHISASDLRSFFEEALTKQQVDLMIRAADANCDGKISFEEFARLDRLFNEENEV